MRRTLGVSGYAPIIKHVCARKDASVGSLLPVIEDTFKTETNIAIPRRLPDCVAGRSDPITCLQLAGSEERLFTICGLL